MSSSEEFITHIKLRTKESINSTRFDLVTMHLRAQHANPRAKLHFIFGL